MPMYHERSERKLAITGTVWNLADWPWMSREEEAQVAAEQEKPRAKERFYDRTGRLVVAVGGVLPDDVEGLLTEAEVMGLPTDTTIDNPAPFKRRRVRRKKT